MLQEKAFKASRKPFNIKNLFSVRCCSVRSISVYFLGANASLDITPEMPENDL